MNTRTQVEMISLRPEFMYTLYSMTQWLNGLLLAVAKCYTTPTRDSLNYHLYFVLKNPREDSPADGSTYQFVLESLLYVSIRIPFRPRFFLCLHPWMSWTTKPCHINSSNFLPHCHSALLAYCIVKCPPTLRNVDISKQWQRLLQFAVVWNILQTFFTEWYI